MHISLLIKPTSSSCNMQCKYCFYHDISSKRTITNYGYMQTDTAKSIIQKAFEFATSAVNFSFQGGEPLLHSKAFYNEFISLVNTYNTKNISVKYSIQTNATLIDDEWCEIFFQNNFLVGVSLDGYSINHNYFRQNSFAKVSKSIRLLKKHNVNYNILTVVTAKLARHAFKVYNEYKNMQFDYIQFIPCLAGSDGENLEHAIDGKTYGEFLVAMFKLYFEDNKYDKKISIRLFDNFLSKINGGGVEMCALNGHCSMQNVIEADGTIFPCDFYCRDEYCLGNITTQSFADILQHPILAKFIETSKCVPTQCAECKYFELCRNGCQRERIDNVNIFCASYKMLFEEMFALLQI